MSIEIKNIQKTFGSYTALDHINLHIPNGSLTALLGPSGSGKTTLLRIVAGLEQPDSGSLSFSNQNVTHLHPSKRGVGFVFQNYALFQNMSVAQNIAFGLHALPKNQRPSQDEIHTRVQDLLDLIQLPRLANRLPNELSGGQRQRVALARALAVHPKVLLLDEPFSALDAKVRKELRLWLRQFHNQIGLTTLFVTHDQEEALELADQVVVMANARIEQIGSPQEIYDNPHTPYVVRFLGKVNEIKNPHQNTYVRPHQIELFFAAEISQPNDQIAKIHRIFSAGALAQVQLKLPDHSFLDAEITRHQLLDLALSEGDTIGFRFREIIDFPTSSNS